jgi:hypothetical protein
MPPLETTNMPCTICAVIFAMLIAVPAAAAKHGHDEHGREYKHARIEENRRFDHFAGGHRFNPHDVRVMSAYYAPRYRSLPPGLQKKLYRTGHLPPGWEKKMRPIPVVVERRLAPLPRAYRRGVFDRYAVIYDPGTHVIVDVALLW